MDQKVCLKFGEERSIVCYCTQKEKMNCEGFTQNGCYGNQPQPFEANSYSSFTNQDLTVK